jgi:hypothetical protein
MENGLILDGVDDDLVRNSSSSSNIKHTTGIIKEKGRK